MFQGEVTGSEFQMKIADMYEVELREIFASQSNQIVGHKFTIPWLWVKLRI